MLPILTLWPSNGKLSNPIDQKRASAVIVQLAVHIIAAVVATPIFLFAVPLAGIRLVFLSLVVLGLVAAVAGIYYVRDGRLSVAVASVVVSQLAMLGVAIVFLGLGRANAFLFAFAVPITFAGLLGSQRMVRFTSAASIVLTCLGVYVDWVFRRDHLFDPLLTVGVFVLAVIMLTFFVGNLSRTLQSALERSLEREQELEQLRTSLEHMVDARTRDLQRALHDGEIREAILARALNDLSDSEARQRAMLDAIPDSIFRVNREGVCVDLKLSSYMTPTAVNPGDSHRNLEAYLPLDYVQLIRQHAKQALETGALTMLEYQLKAEEQVWDFEVRMVACGNDEVLGIVRDITERKKVDRMKSEFISVVSHELRTPLTSIRGAIGLVTGGVAGPIPPQASEMLRIAQTNGERLLRLINDILDIEKVESGRMSLNMQSIALAPLITQAVAADAAYGTQFNVHVQLVEPLPDVQVHVDSDRLQQVLANLLSNAIKFSTAGETVLVRAERDGEWVRVLVEDRGPGIPESFQDRIFQKFAQADASNARQHGGTGLGLSISKALIERFGGIIGFRSEPGKGSTFYFELPVDE